MGGRGTIEFYCIWMCYVRVCAGAYVCVCSELHRIPRLVFSDANMTGNCTMK